MTTEVQNQGYNAKNKININQRNMSQFVNVNYSKPSTGNKVKSNSLVYKVAPAGTKDVPIMFKIIEKSKIKGY